MAGYRLFLFGAPRLEYRGQQVSMDTRKAMALLAYALLTGKPHTRDALAAMFWPESDQHAARAALRRTLSTLRKAFGDAGLDFGRDTITLKPEADLWCDVLVFRRKFQDTLTHGHDEKQVCPRCLAPLKEAAECFKEDFMAGFGLRDSPAFDDWQFFESDQLNRERANVLDRLVVLLAVQREFVTAADYGRRWLSIDPLNESAHRTLAGIYALSGQRNAALRQYRQCVRILDQELGVSPLKETTQLYEQIKENQLDRIERQLLASFSSEETGPAEIALPKEKEAELPPRHSFPLVGRDEEWQVLVRAYNRITKDGVLIALMGEAGVGKTRLGEEFIHHLQSQGGIALAARCYEGESHLAYAPILDLLRQGINQSAERSWWQRTNLRWLSEASLLLPEIFDIHPQLPPRHEGPGAQSRMYEGVCQILEALVTHSGASGTRAGALFLDNLEWADESTLDLLAYLARRISGRPMLLLLAWREGASQASRAVEHLVNEVVRLGNGVQIRLSVLTDQQVESLIASVDGAEGKLSLGLKTQLAEKSGGLPFFLVEYLEAALREDLPAGLDGDPLPVPEGIRGMLQAQFVGLREAARQAIQASAVIGRVFTASLLQGVSGRSEEEVVQAIEELLARGVIWAIQNPSTQPNLEPRYDFKHDQMRQLVLEEISMVRRQLLHRRTAEAYLEQGRHHASPMLGQIAQHFQQAGLLEQAADYYYQAGVYARSLHANSDALAHFAAALALGHPYKPAILVHLGELNTLIGDYPRAIERFEAAAALSELGQFAPIEHKIGLVLIRLGKWEQAACHFEAALLDLAGQEFPQPESFEARVQADWSLALHRSGNAVEASQRAQNALVLAEAAGDPLALGQAHNLLGILARAVGDPASGLRHLQQSLTYAGDLSAPSARIATLNNLALVQADLGETLQAVETILQAIEACVSLGDRHLEAALRNNYADLLRIQDKTEASMAQLKQAVTLFAQVGQRIEDWEPEIWKLVEW